MVSEKEITKTFLKAIAETFKAYNESGARSNKKLIPIHRWFAHYLETNLGKGYSVRSLGNGGEVNLSGKYYPKNLDISVLKKDKIITTISFKFVTSNYKQNANNYFENLLGETANIRRMNVGFAHFLVLRAKTPYYNKNKGNLRGDTIKIETLNDRDLSKYIKLFQDNDFPHKPDVLGISILNFNEEGEPSVTNLGKLNISKSNSDILNKELGLKKFLDRFISLCELKS
jgi:hypothetical protein